MFAICGFLIPIRALAREVNVNESYLSRLLRGRDYKRNPSPSLLTSVSRALGLPPDYFPEAREHFVIERIRDDGALRDKLYQRFRKS